MSTSEPPCSSTSAVFGTAPSRCHGGNPGGGRTGFSSGATPGGGGGGAGCSFSASAFCSASGLVGCAGVLSSVLGAASSSSSSPAPAANAGCTKKQLEIAVANAASLIEKVRRLSGE